MTNSAASAKAAAPCVNLQGIANLMNQIGALEESVLGTRDADFLAAARNTGLGLFRLVVMGEIKKGKSSFINALLGIPDLSPVHSDVATSTVYKIRYGKALRYTVYFKQDSGAQAARKLDIAPEQVVEYGTEKGNKNNEKKVDFIAIQAPSQLLKDGLIIVDTPGVGGLFREHRDITFRHAPRADAVFFITDSVESPIGREEVDFLKELRKVTGLLFFIQTKGDKADAGERRKRMDNNVGILKAEVGIPEKDIRYFVVSSKLRLEAAKTRKPDDLEDSGFLPVLQLLNVELKDRKDRNLAAMALDRSGARIAVIGQEVQRQEEILGADTAEKIGKLDQELEQVSAAFQGWAKERLPELEREFRTELSRLRMDRLGELTVDLRPAGTVSQELRRQLHALDSADAIYGAADRLLADARAAASSRLVGSSRRAEEEATRLVQALALKAGSDLAITISPQQGRGEISSLQQSAMSTLLERGTDISFFARSRSAFYGATFGVMGAGAVGGIVGSVIPVVGTIIGSFAGMAIAGLWGAAEGYKYQKRQERAQVLREVESAVDQELGRCQIVVQNEFSKMFLDLENAGVDGLKKIVAQTSAGIARQKAEIAARRKETKEDLDRKRAALDANRKRLALLKKQIAAMSKAIKG
jgi:hypothetical protein